MDTKKWNQSKTVWFNILGMIAGVATMAGFDVGLTAETQAEIVMGVLAIGNVVLRFMTRTGIG